MKEIENDFWNYALIMAFIAVVIPSIAFVIFVHFFPDEPTNCLYQMDAVVCDVSDDLVTVESQGNLWGFYGDGYSVGDNLIVTMDSSGTQNIYDDSIHSVEFK